MTRLLPLQGVVLSISFPRVSLRSALGYVLNGLSGRSSSAVKHFLVDPRCGLPSVADWHILFRCRINKHGKDVIGMPLA